MNEVQKSENINTELFIADPSFLYQSIFAFLLYNDDIKH